MCILIPYINEWICVGLHGRRTHWGVEVGEEPVLILLAIKRHYSRFGVMVDWLCGRRWLIVWSITAVHRLLQLFMGSRRKNSCGEINWAGCNTRYCADGGRWRYLKTGSRLLSGDMAIYFAYEPLAKLPIKTIAANTIWNIKQSIAGLCYYCRAITTICMNKLAGQDVARIWSGPWRNCWKLKSCRLLLGSNNHTCKSHTTVRVLLQVPKYTTLYAAHDLSLPTSRAQEFSRLCVVLVA